MFNKIKKRLRERRFKKIISSLERTIDLLSQSEESIYATHTPKELIEKLSYTLEIINEPNMKQKLQEISILYAPTGSIQDISIDNGWGEEFIKLSVIVD